jgi:C-methyltransferase
MKNKEILKMQFTSYWSYFAIVTACKLGVFDFLYNNQAGVNSIASKLSLNRLALEKLLDALVEGKMLIFENGKYQNSEQTELLTEKHPESLKYACLNWFEDHLKAWQNLPQTIITGKSHFELNYNTDYFTYISSNNQKLHDYHKAMREYALDDYRNICSIIDFSIHKSVMDVGGGASVLTNIIKANNFDVECINFDLPEVIKLFPQKDVQSVKGNFFEYIPPLSDAIILARIIHDWDDEKASTIIQNCYQALPEGGKLYIIENCKDLCDKNLSLLSLNMMLICNSFERSSKEYTKLAENCEFSFIEMRKLNELQTIIVFKK